MIRFLVIIAVIGAFCYFAYTILFAPQTATDHSQQGVAMMFISATMANDNAKIESICEPTPRPTPSASPASWPLAGGRFGSFLAEGAPGQRRRGRHPGPDRGQGRILIVEVNKHGESWKIQSVGLASI